jgi:hypothetical protein
MKQLLKEIVKRITDNLLGKSNSGSETDRHSHLTRDGSHHSVIIIILKQICIQFYIHLNNRVNYLFDLLCAIMLILWINIKNYYRLLIQIL